MVPFTSQTRPSRYYACAILQMSAFGSTCARSADQGPQHAGSNVCSKRYALAMRNAFIRVLERASVETDPETRKRLLTIVIAGGGPTGVPDATFSKLTGIHPLTRRKSAPGL